CRLRQVAKRAKSLWRAADVRRAETLIQGDAFQTHGLQQPSAVQSQPRRIILEAQLVVARLAVGDVVGKRSQSGKVAQTLGERARGDSALRISGVKLFDLRQQHGGLQLGEGTDQIAAQVPRLGSLEHVGSVSEQGATAAGTE